MLQYVGWTKYRVSVKYEPTNSEFVTVCELVTSTLQSPRVTRAARLQAMHMHGWNFLYVVSPSFTERLHILVCYNIIVVLRLFFVFYFFKLVYTVIMHQTTTTLINYWTTIPHIFMFNVTYLTISLTYIIATLNLLLSTYIIRLLNIC